jgi:glycosyltransferase involved in cell wall biosynthesis
MVRFRAPLIKELVAQGYEVVCAAAPADAATERQLATIGARFLPIPMRPDRTRPLHDLRTLWTLFRTLQRERPTLVLTYNMKPLVYGTLAAWLTGVDRRVAMVEGLGYAYTPGREWKRRLARVVSNLLYTIPCALSDAMIVNNKDDHAFFARRFMWGRESRLHLVPGLGIDLEQFTPEPMPAGPLTFVMIAPLLRDKGVYEFAEAARRLKQQQLDVRFVLIGGVETGSQAVRRRDLETWVRDGSVEYVGEVDDVRPWIRQSHVLVLPSYREGLPRAVMEAMAMGRPCIVTDVPGCRDVVAHHRTGMIVGAYSAAALTEAATLIIRKRRLLDPWSRAAIDAAKRNFDASRQAATMVAKLQAA